MSNESFEIEILAMAHGGRGLGRHEKRTIFMPYVIPGEIVHAHITEDKGRIAFAQGVDLVDVSADRVFPRCPHFGPGRCWGCHWQHIDDAAQALIKQDVIADQLARIGGFDDADVQPIVPSPVTWGYRHHMTFVVTEQGQFGLNTADGAATPVEECHILHPDLLDLYERIDFDTTGIHQMKLQIGSDGAHMLLFYVDTEHDAPELLADLKTSVNLILPDNEPVNLIGESHSRYTVGGRTFRVTAGGDFRANIAQLGNLLEIVLAQVEPGGSVLDLYGGVGLFSAFLADDADVVTLVESFPPAATDADENLADRDNVDIIEGTVEDVLDSLDDAETTYTAAVLDPPSEGLSLEAVDLLGESGIPRLIYVSSDPATLARDTKRLVSKGYALGKIFPIDMHPHAYYADAVAVFDSS